MAKRRQKKGNKDAWSDKEVIKVVAEMIADANENPTINTLMSICSRAQINQDCICDWEKKFAKNPPVLRSIGELRQILHARLVERALNNEINAGFTKFLLKSKFGYKEEESNVTIIKSDSINISFDDDDNNEEDK
jgi:hypothetical protein